jgi:hypothetical protein
VYRRASVTAQWFASAVFLFLMGYYLLWLDWFQRPETLPTTCFVVIMLALLSARARSVAALSGIALATLCVSLLQALTRADVAFCIYLGILLFTLSPAGLRLPAPRVFNATLAAAAALLAGATQWVMMHVVYPHATYGSTAVVQLEANLVQPLRLMAFAFFMAPVGATTWMLLRRRTARTAGASPEALDAPLLALFVGACLFFPIWIVLGKIDEVRIFLPFAVALIPLTVSLLLEPAVQASGLQAAARQR